MKKRIFAAFMAVVALLAFLVVPISATVAAEPYYNKNDQFINFDFYKTFPFLNMLNPVRYLDKSGDYGGASLSIDKDGVIDVTGMVTEPSAGLLNYYDIVLFDAEVDGFSVTLPYDNVTFASNIVEQRAYMHLFLSDGSRFNIWDEPVTFNGAGLSITKLVLRLKYDTKTDFMTIKPTLNYGNVAYPFMPFSKAEELFSYGYDKGYDEGIFSPSAEEYWVQIGYDYGYIDGEAVGYENGWHEGVKNGYDHGYDHGIQDGEIKGYEIGYEEGYSEGFGMGTDYGEQQEVSKNIIGVVDSIASAPSKAIGTMLDFEIFGFKIDTLVFRIITLILVVAVIGFVFKFFLR